ncbi:MAG: AAA family ATPase [Candidatus Woesearchaeota archaeon]
MKLIIIYGPPAVGKLTVAKELAKIIGFKVFHNHLTLDVVQAVFTSQDRVFWSLTNELRLRVIEVAAQEKIKGIIYTSGYNGNSKDDVLEHMVRIMRKYNGEIFFARLTCDKKELFKRVRSEDRKKYTKTTTLVKLRRILPRWNNQRDYPHKNNLTLNNTSLSAKNIARKIKNHFQL